MPRCAAVPLGLASACLALGLSSAALATPKPQPPPQVLPLEAQWCLESGSCILLEVARTPQQQMWGLQLRPPLKPLRGMLFPFEPAQPVKFWMHRTPEPLDMVFVRSGQVIAIEANVPPCMHLPCRSYGPYALVDGVIELGAGQARLLGIQEGSAAIVAPRSHR
jgi:uncharacterized membrane protein (UPF0127 family)